MVFHILRIEEDGLHTSRVLVLKDSDGESDDVMIYISITPCKWYYIRRPRHCPVLSSCAWFFLWFGQSSVIGDMTDFCFFHRWVEEEVEVDDTTETKPPEAHAPAPAATAFSNMPPPARLQPSAVTSADDEEYSPADVEPRSTFQRETKAPLSRPPASQSEQSQATAARAFAVHRRVGSLQMTRGDVNASAATQRGTPAVAPSASSSLPAIPSNVNLPPRPPHWAGPSATGQDQKHDHPAHSLHSSLSRAEPDISMDHGPGHNVNNPNMVPLAYNRLNRGATSTSATTAGAQAAGESSAYGSGPSVMPGSSGHTSAVPSRSSLPTAIATSSYYPHTSPPRPTYGFAIKGMSGSAAMSPPTAAGRSVFDDSERQRKRPKRSPSQERRILEDLQPPRQQPARMRAMAQALAMGLGTEGPADIAVSQIDLTIAPLWLSQSADFIPAGQLPAGQLPAGQLSTGQLSAAQLSAGQLSAAELPAAQLPAA